MPFSMPYTLKPVRILPAAKRGPEPPGSPVRVDCRTAALQSGALPPRTPEKGSGGPVPLRDSAPGGSATSANGKEDTSPPASENSATTDGGGGQDAKDVEKERHYNAFMEERLKQGQTRTVAEPMMRLKAAAQQQQQQQVPPRRGSAPLFSQAMLRRPSERRLSATPRSKVESTSKIDKACDADVKKEATPPGVASGRSRSSPVKLSPRSSPAKTGPGGSATMTSTTVPSAKRLTGPASPPVVPDATKTAGEATESPSRPEASGKERAAAETRRSTPPKRTPEGAKSSAETQRTSPPKKTWAVSVGDLWADLGQEQAASAQAAEMLEAETAERLRLDKEVRELQARCCQLQQQKDRLEMEAMESRMLRSADLNGHLSDEDDGVGGSSVYKQKYERAVREAEMTRRKASQQHEEELEKQLLARKATEKRLTEALDSLEEGRQAVGQWKRKAQKLAAELQDLKLLVEEHMARNAELERKQRRFDGELSTASEGMRQERAQREKVQREKEALYAEKLSLEQELSAVRSELDSQHDKLGSLRREMDELSFSSHGEEEVAKLKRGKQELERKSREQEEELEDLAGQVQLLEQAKLRLEMALEKQRQEYKREISLREEEMDEARAAASKKLRNLESLLESEQEERQALSRQRQELERRLGELSALPPPRDPQVERRLRRDLRRTRALLQDAQQRLEGARDGQAARALLRQLKNQLEDAEFAKTAAMKARQGAEMELQEVQCQLEEVLRTKNESEGRCIQLTREKSALQMQLEEMEEEQAELLKKYRSAVQQMASDQKAMAEQNQQILDLESEKHHLREQVHDLSSKMDHLSSQAEDSHAVRRLEAKVRDLESRLELEQTSKARLESQVARLKEQSGRLQEECEQAAQREHASQEGCRKLQRQLRELREDCASLQQREAEAHQRCHELELSLENAETDLQGTKQDLKLACQRIQDLQAALEEDLDSGTDLADDDSESDSDQDMDVDSLLRRHGLGPHKMAAGDCSPVFSRRSSGSVGLSLSRSNESTPSGPVSPDATEQRGNGRTLYKDDQLVDLTHQSSLPQRRHTSFLCVHLPTGAATRAAVEGRGQQSARFFFMPGLYVADRRFCAGLGLWGPLARLNRRQPASVVESPTSASA
ncbi:myosin heavy chain, putative [Ixodes scapularis]|uniref:Myosin heavy chain, putative n=1 Tax=Ixodes scapularis TaxID=6945 RepID=B7PG31_IXOSC|nr:myosin heavy chain, putative [Ixodes scapularis]|eukprot:XP_002434153.1 myosin heavy chain, putative [Ixodes scapularis]